MKYIFRYTILTQYTSNPDNLKASDLVSTLKSINFSQMDRIEAIIDLCRIATDALIKNIGKAAQSGSETTREVIAQAFGPEYEPQLEDLLQVW